MKVKTIYLLKFFLSVTILIGGISSCEKSNAIPGQIDSPKKNSDPEQDVILTTGNSQPPLFITYKLDSIENATSVDSFRNKYTTAEQEFIYALNRIDAYRLDAGDVIIIPDTLTTNFLDYSPFPETFEMLDSIPKVVLISRRIQGFALYEQGKLIRWGPTSSGKKSTPTPAGLFYGNHKAVRKVSTVNKSWILPYYFNFMNYEGVGVHQYDMPGYPASHACVRLRMEDAQEIYSWAEQWKLDSTGQIIQRNGTPFMVYGDYDFEVAVPWLELADDPNSNFLTADEMGILKEYSIQYKKDKRNFDPPALPPGVLEIPVGEEHKELQ